MIFLALQACKEIFWIENYQKNCQNCQRAQQITFFGGRDGQVGVSTNPFKGTASRNPKRDFKKY